MIAALLVAATSLAALPEPAPVSQKDSAQWQQYLVPLPKQVAINRKITLPMAEIAVIGPDGKNPVLAQAQKELHELLGQTDHPTDDKHATFTIALQLLMSGTSDLTGLKNSDQAYHIAPSPSNSPAALTITAIHPTGLYYGTKTLIQLMRPRIKDGQVDIPLARITDWPDMEDRGLWGADNYDHIVWMSDRKLNIVEQISDIGIDENGKTYARLKGGREPMVTLGPSHAVQPVPAILHLEQISGKGVFRAHPELKGQGGQEGCICYSKPGFVDVLADWIVALCQLPGVDDVDVWMAENLHGEGGCKCDECKKTDRSVLEARVIAAAYAKARQRVPRLTLRILTSEETEGANTDVFKALPPDIRIWYYHSLLSYSAGEEPMVRGYLRDFARQGRWVGMCPNVVPVVHFAEPDAVPQFVHYRMNEFVDAGLSGLIGYATPRAYYGFFSVEATAEWSWNAKGRSPREFATSWAVRQGFGDPELFADYVDAFGPVAWDCYGSDWPNGEQREMVRVAKKLKDGDLSDLGFVLWGVYRSPWGDIKNVDQLNRDVELADKAVAIAQRLNKDEFIHGSLIVQGYIRSLKALHELRQVVKAGKVDEDKKPLARKHFKAYIDSLNQSAVNLPAWEATLPMRKPDENFTKRPCDTIAQMIAEMKKVAADAGCAD
jgi:hypothetical protein